MMTTLTLTVTALFVYLCATGYLIYLLKVHQSLDQRNLIILTGIAIAFHSVSIYQLMVYPTGLNLSITNVFSLIIASVNILVILRTLSKPLHSLFILLSPLSILSLAFVIQNGANDSTITSVNWGIGTHIVLSIIAYSLLSMAVLQALLLHWQNNRLKQRHPSNIIKHLPPLQTMESLMFELLWAGVILLAGGLLLGAIYIDDIFSQHLVHKTTLSIIAWIIFATLLWGRIKWGWRGNQAVRWILTGFCTLMIAYFGSKFVLDVILI